MRRSSIDPGKMINRVRRLRHWRTVSGVSLWASIALLTPVHAQHRPDVGQEASDDQPVVSRKIAVPADAPSLPPLRPLEPLAQTFESEVVPQLDTLSVAALVRYLNDLTSLSEHLSRDFRQVQAGISREQVRAASAILLSSSEVSDEDFYRAARLALATPISQIPFSTREQHEQTIGWVTRQLEVGVKQGFRLEELRNATRTAENLERHADPDLARQAAAQFIAILESAQGDRDQETLALLQEIQRRLELIGKPLELSGTTVDGGPLDWSDYAGRVVLVNFWAPSNLASISELPQLKRLYETYHPLGFEIIGICLDRDRKELETVIEKEQISWSNLLDPDHETGHPMATRYGVRSAPTAFLVDRDGKVVSIRARGEELQRWLTQLLGDPAAAEPAAEPSELRAGTRSE